MSVREVGEPVLPVRARLAGCDSHELHRALAEYVLLAKKSFLAITKTEAEKCLDIFQDCGRSGISCGYNQGCHIMSL